MSLEITSLIRAIPGNMAQGIIWGIMALGLYISFKVLDFSDLTVDGSFATGGCICAVLIMNDVNPYLSLLFAFLVGSICGFVTSFLYTKLHIAPILAGILTQLALYSVDLHILGNKANQALSVGKVRLVLSLRNIPKAIIIGLIIAVFIIGIFYWFFGTEIGAAIRACGDNKQMAVAQGINTDRMTTLAICLSNGLIAVAGGLICQYQGYADVSMGKGAMVIGLACIIIGDVIYELFLKKINNFALNLFTSIIGGVVYYLCIGFVLWLNLPTNDLKLFTAIMVALFLYLPNLKKGAH